MIKLGGKTVNWKRALLWGLGLWLLSLAGVMAATPEEMLVFSQIDHGKQTIYIYQPTNAKLQLVVSGAKIAVFLQKKHFYYFLDHQLYEYYPGSNQSKLLYKFSEDKIRMRVVAAENGLNQLLIVASTEYTEKWYILDVNEANLRRIEQPAYAPSANIATKYTLASPDDKYVLTLRGSIYKRVNLLVQQKKVLKNKTVWQLPGELSVMPELITWAPDGKTLLFYAKPGTGFEGFYSLYALQLDQLKLQTLAETVLYRDFFGSSGLDEFAPSWSADSRYVVFQSQPNGSPSQSILMKYDRQTGKTSTLTESRGQNQYPRIAPSGTWIAFISNREYGRKQLYLVDRQGQGLVRLTPDGVTEWAEWFQQ
jgi:tricorn protease-like protein